MSNNLIDNSNGDIVLQEKPIRVTDEKLKTTLWQVYERSRKDARTFRLCNHYGIFISVGSTLFVSLLTSEFKDLGPENAVIFSSLQLTRAAWIICILSFAFGIILAISLVNIIIRLFT